MENSEDEVSRDNQYVQDPDDDGETSEALIRAFSLQNNHVVEEEFNQVTQNEGLPPRRMQHEKLHFKNQDVKPVTADRPNTILFSSKVSQ